MIISDPPRDGQLQNNEHDDDSNNNEISTNNDALDVYIGAQSQDVNAIPLGINAPAYDEEPELSKPIFSDNSLKASQSAKKSYQNIQDKENTNIEQIQTSQGSSYMHRSTSDINYQQMNEEGTIENDNIDSSDYKDSIQSSIRSSQKKKAKRSQSKDPKIIQTMKAYFPGLNQVKEQKKNAFPQQAAPKQLVYGSRSSTQGSNNKAQVYNERIIFVEDSRKSNKKNVPNQQQRERRNSNLQSANGDQGSAHQQSNSQSYRKNVTQLPPIDKKSNVEILDQKSPRVLNKVLSPINNQEVHNSYFPDPTRQNLQMHQSWSSKRQQEENIVIGMNDDVENQNLQRKVDFEKKNQALIQKMQEKKMLEQKTMEEQRRKAIKKQEKLKKLILSQAAEHRGKKNNTDNNQQQQDANMSKTPVKRKANSQPPTDGTEEDVDEDKKKHDMMKKFYRNRYASFLKAIQDQKKQKEQELEEIKKVEQKKKAKLKEEIGLGNVQSRFLDDLSKINKETAEVREKVIVEEVANKGKKDKPKRGSSTTGMKSMASTASFNTGTKIDQSVDVIKIYQQSVGSSKRERSSSKSLKRALTPKVKKSKKVIVMGNSTTVDEKDEEELIKEQKAKKEAAEKIKQRQQKYLQDLQDKKEKELKLQEEEKKKQEKQKQYAREQAKQNFEKLQNQPGLKELQDSKQEDDEEKSNVDSVKKKSKKAKVPESGIEAFIERNNPKRTNFPNITDMSLWKKKFKVDENTKVFICTGGYPDIKKALKSRGWVQNKDPLSPCFDFKWVLKAKDIDHNTLNDNQLVNHFNKAAAITTKVGLCHNLKNLIWFNNVDIDTFYPRCFDLAMQEELEDYIQEFKAVKAETYIKTFVRQMRESGSDKTTITDKVLKVALKVCEKRVKDLDELIDDPTAFSSLVTDEEWKILGADELNVETLAQKKHEDWMLKNDIQLKKNKEKEEQKKKKKKKKKAKQDEEQAKEDANKVEEEKDDIEEEEVEKDDGDTLIATKHPEFKRAVKVLEELKKKFPQFGLNGEDNIWIIKPAGLSRGRGIVLYKQLVEILDLVKSKESQYIAQKYIENTMIVKKRKFDIRQWVLVTDWNPLTIWLYKEPYFRFPASDYNADNIMDKFIHLTNNSIAKYAEGQGVVTHDIPGNMMDFQEFNAYLQEEYGWDVWEDKLIEQTKNIVINTLESVQDNFECKKGCFELYGFDLMIDEDFNMWLIEVNSSPAMDYSTDVTTRLVKMVLEDCIKVVVDHASAKKKSKVDTGSFECIYKAKRMVDRPMKSFGLNLVCEGKKIASNKLGHY